MPKKLATTPDGIICRVCGEDKPPYHFFKPRGKYNKAFFADGIPDGHTCWDCAGDYRCLGCGHVKPAYQFRIQGRFCVDCIAENNTTVTVFKVAAVGSDTSTNSSEAV